jgi:predicted O-linked N-acetylglucosamine transferase (SPINDLY family)
MKWVVSVFGLIGGSLWLNLGNWLERNGMAMQAEACYRNCAAGAGKAAAEAGFRLSQQLLGRGLNREAVIACVRVLRHDRGHAKAWCAFGAARRRMAKMSTARKAYEMALALDPGYAQAWCNLGEWQLAKGDNATALGNFEQALKLESGLVEALNNRVAALYELGRFKDAETAAKAAIEVHPNAAALHVNMGNVLLHSGKARPAVKSYRKALECDPSCAEAHLSLATLFGETNHLGEALAYIEHDIAVKGKSAQRLASLALAQKIKGDLAAAETTCQQVLEMQPDNISALITLAGCLSARGDHRGAIRLHQQAIASQPQMPAVFSNIAFDSTYLPEISAQEVFDYHREWARRFEEPAADSAFSHERPAPIDRPLRIGYVSGDFGRHPVGFLLRDVIRHHGREHFYVHCYSMMRRSDEITAAIRESAASWVDALMLSDDELAEQIKRDRIDILVDLSGHTAYNRMPSFARKPAPVQATWIGYFHSTGLTSVDYFITDPYTSPQGCRQLFSETPVWLPHTRFCYSPPDYVPEVAPPPVLTQGRITFGSFNRIEKLAEPVIKAWAAILMAVPDSRLLLKAGTLENEGVRDELRHRFTTCGVDGERLQLQGPSSHPEMLAQYGEIDIALDPFPFNGGMTTLEALWMGVPVVTVAGQGVVSRQTVSALANLQLTELAFPDIESYIQGAIALAGNHQRLVELRRILRPRMAASPLRQPEQFARDLEALYRRMWQAWCRGEKLPSDV